MSGILLPGGCCCPKGSSDECVYCGITPVQLSVLFSSLTVCTNCWVTGSGTDGYKYIVAPSAPVGPYVLSQMTGQSPFGNCDYEYNATGLSVQVGRWHNFPDPPDCTGEPTETITYDKLNIRAALQANGAICLSAMWFFGTYASPTAGAIIFLNRTDTGTGDCNSFNALSNERTDCDVIPGGGMQCALVGCPELRDRGCKDGAATVTPVWD